MDISNKPLEARVDYALKVLSEYPLTDGEHYREWLLDQTVRILLGVPTVAASAVDSRGETYIYPALGTSERYDEFVANVAREGGEWSSGIAP